MRGTPPSPYRHDEEGVFRIIARPISFGRFVSVLCDQSRPYIAKDRNATIKMLTVLTELVFEASDEEHIAVLHDQLKKLRAASLHYLEDDAEQEDLIERFDMSARMVSDDAYFKAMRYSEHWIGGRA